MLDAMHATQDDEPITTQLHTPVHAHAMPSDTNMSYYRMMITPLVVAYMTYYACDTLSKRQRVAGFTSLGVHSGTATGYVYTYSARALPRAAVIDVLRDVLRTDGIRGLWAGLGVNALKLLPVWTAVLAYAWYVPDDDSSSQEPDDW